MEGEWLELRPYACAQHLAWTAALGAAHASPHTSAAFATSLTLMFDVCLLLLKQTLVHALAALALMGLGCLWLLMNLSAEFAHARRDMRELPGRSPTTLTRVRHAAEMTL